MRRWLPELVLGAVLPAVLLGGCTGLPAPFAPPASGDQPSAATPRIAALASDLRRALTGGDRALFVRSFADEPEPRRRATELWDNLALLDDVTVGAAGESALEIGWRVPGDEAGVATEVPVVLALVEGRSVATWLGSPTRPAIWQLGDLVVDEGAAGTVLALDDLSGARVADWGRHLAHAAATLGKEHLGVFGSDWNGDLVVILPATAQQYLDLTGGGTTATAAVTQCERGQPRVVVNPDVLGEGWDYLDALLLHEATHVVAKSSCESGAELWVDEGAAEWMAGRHHASARLTTERWVREWVRRHGLPKTLPTAAAFASDDPDEVSAAYALAAVAIGASVDAIGERATFDWIDRATSRDGSTSPALVRRVTRWYLAAVSRLVADT
jgi:hypothetical protein